MNAYLYGCKIYQMTKSVEAVFHIPYILVALTDFSPCLEAKKKYVLCLRTALICQLENACTEKFDMTMSLFKVYSYFTCSVCYFVS